MDELLHHCLRELAFDGDLGTNVSRLKDFVVDFYAHTNTSHAQNPDDAFCAFVWALVVQQPTVIVGLVSPDISSEVWIAPQTSAKRKAQARGEDHIEQRPPKLDPIPEPKTTSLDTLHHAYGDRLRLAVEPDAIFAAITGSHIRSSKMSPMVYSALQIITRGRDAGVTVVELGKQSGYDQKTCFYLVRQLTELELVVKVRRGGVGTHFCIHKYFFERSSSWKAIRDEETQAETLQTKSLESEVDFRDEDEDEDIEDSEGLNFTPIDARHLSSFPLISGRVIRLLKASKNHMHASNNMLITLGFSNPTKTDRRFFQSRVREMIQQQLIEKVVVPSNKKNSSSKSVKCFRLVKQEPSTPGDTGIILSDAEDDMGDIAFVQNGIKFNTTIHKQIIDQLEDAGTSGMTLNELSTSLCQFDKRTIELLLARADTGHAPSHLSDLRIASLMETSGRERRHRYFTVANYRKLVVQEKLDKTSAGYDDVDLKDVGGFLPADAHLFYETDAELIQYSDGFKDNDKTRVSKAKKKQPKNPILPDGKVKRGRPRKSAVKCDEDDLDMSISQAAKRKRGDISPAIEQAEEPKKKRGRPSKKSLEDTQSLPVKRGRGRPRKAVDAEETMVATIDSLEPSGPPNADNHPLRSTPEREGASTSPERTLPNSGSIEQSHLEETGVLLSMEPQNQNQYMEAFKSPTAVQDASADIPSSLIRGIENPQDIVNPPKPTIDSEIPASTGGLVAECDNNAVIESVCDAIDTPRANEGDVHLSPHLPATSSSSGKIAAPTPNATRINVSQLRRENELFRVIENAGGIVNIQTKEFYQAHMKLLELLTQTGEPTSAPVGTKTDKRTATATFNSLESKGRIKQLRTSVTTLTGVTRPACIIYLPHVEQSRINAYLADLARNSQQPTPHLNSFVKIDRKLEYGADSSSNSRGILPLQLLQLEQPGLNEKERWSKNVSRAQQLFSHDDTTIRDVFLAERTTVAQLYSFIVGKALRCRELHLTGIRAFEMESDSPHIVSQEKRVIDLSFFCLDLPIQLYCSLVSPLTFDEELTALLATETGQKTLVRDLPQNLQSSLQVGRSRARSRFLDMLEILRSLNLVTPLQPSISSSGDPFVTCEQKGEHPTSFDIASLDGWTINTPTIAPIYWFFHENIPIHLYAKSETHPPYWKTIKVSSYSDGIPYWNDLREACLNPHINVEPDNANSTEASTAGIAAARSLRRAVSWKSEYFLTWHQMQYMKQFIDTSSFSTPLQISNDAERQNQIKQIAWVTSMPEETVENYFSSSRDKLLRSSERMKEKARKIQKRTEETKLSLAKKAEEARTQREQEWSILLMKSHPDVLTGPAAVRVERIRNQFLQSVSTQDASKWERDIQTTLHEADLANSKALKITAKRPVSTRKAPAPPPAISPALESIQSLIDSQGPPLQQPRVTLKRRRRKGHEADPLDSNVPKKTTRRHRFQWNAGYDELARDASAIIRARCRNLSRLDWGAFEQVFPSVPRNTVRQRLSHIKETPGNEAYLRRLEDTWYDIWLKYRGTPTLPDDDIESASNFNLVKHIEFLRTHVDKNAIRVGFAHAKESATSTLPSDVESLQKSYNVVQVEKAAPDWDFMWNALIEEGREKKLKKAVISRCPEVFPVVRTSELDEIALAEATLKMAMGTPPERYDPARGSSLLKTWGQEVIDIATKNLLSRGVLSKSQRDPQKQGPGRQLKISEANQNAIGGSIARDTFQDAISLLEEIDPNDTTWHEWPLTATDGDCATLIELVSEDKVDFNVDTSLPQAERPGLDWNSKKADDNQIETAIAVRYRLTGFGQDISSDDLQTATMATESTQECADSPEPINVDTGHGRSIENRPACCRRMTGLGFVDCALCLSDAWTMFRGSLDRDDQETADWILDIVSQGRESGIRKADLALHAGARSLRMAMIVNQMVEADVPLIHWMGYSSLVLVSAQYLARWTVVVSEDPFINALPRRWLDIRGNRVADFWQSGLRAVMGLIIFRPGITQTEIRWRLRAVYDRQEVTDLLRYLHEEGYLRVRLGYSSVWTSCGMDMPFDEGEERKVFWFIGDKHWYQL